MLSKLLFSSQDRGVGSGGPIGRRWRIGALSIALLSDSVSGAWQVADGEGLDAARSASARLVVLFVVVVGVLLFGAVALVFLRSSRRYRQWLLRRRPDATPADDIWSKNKVRDAGDDAGFR